MDAFELSTWCWVFGTVVLYCVGVGAIVYFNASVHKRGWTFAFRRTMIIILLADLIAFLIPYVFTQPYPDKWAQGIATSIYAVAQTISIQAPIDVVDVAHESLDPLGLAWVAAFYGIALNVYALFTPLVVVTTAINSLRHKFHRLEFLAYARSRDTAYLFFGISDVQVSLARDILAHRAEAATAPGDANGEGLHPLIVFCGVKDKDREEQSTLVQKLMDKGQGDVLFSHLDFDEVIPKLRRLKHIHVFSFGDSHEENVEQTAGVIEFISHEAAREAGTDVRTAETYARRFSVYCTHETQDDELIFDSLAAPSDDPSLDPNVVHAARGQVEGRLVSLTQERVYGVLTQHPLFLVLDPLAATKPLVTQHLYVVVAGLGANGMEALKTAYWMGRMRGVDLHVLGIDKRGAAIEESLKYSCPEMMEELDDEGRKVVTIKSAQVNTPPFRETIEAIPRDARVYAMVTLGDDQLNLDVALELRRIFDDMIMREKMDDPGKERRPMVLPLICAPETFAAAGRMATDRDEDFSITPFGKTDDVFSYHNIVVAPWERYSLCMNAAYDEVWNDPKKRPDDMRGTKVLMPHAETMSEYNEFEIKKLSNRTCVRHIPYRLWSVGVDPHIIASDGTFAERKLSNDEWYQKLQITAEDADMLLRPHGSNGDVDAARAELERFRKSYPMVCELADLEHYRWMAFYRSQGWRDLTIEDCERLVAMGVIKKLSTHQSPKLRRHCYLCDVGTLLDRGVTLGDDPIAYDRAAVIETQRILAGTILDEDAGYGG